MPGPVGWLNSKSQTFLVAGGCKEEGAEGSSSVMFAQRTLFIGLRQGKWHRSEVGKEGYKAGASST